MPLSSLHELAPLRRLALFTLALSGLLVGAIALARIALPTEWATIGISWLLLCAMLLGPLALLDRISPPGRAWPRDLLAGPCTVAALILLWLFGFLGTFGLAAIAILALLGLVAALKAELPGAKPGRLVAWLAVALLVAVPLAVNLDGTKYANFIADRLMLFGRADGDTLFHAALINAVRYYGVAATGVDGIVPTSYHVGVHLLAARIAVLAGADAIPALIAVRAILLAPLLFFAVAAGAVVWARRRGAATDRPMLAAIVAFVITLGLGALHVGAVGFNSESALLAAAVIMLVFPPFMLAFAERKIGRIGWTVAALLVLPLAAAKISFGFVWAGLIGWWALRKLGPRRVGFWLIAIAEAALFGIGMWLFSPGRGEQIVWFGTPYYVEVVRDGTYLAPVLINIIGLVLFAVMVHASRRPQADALSGRPAGDVAEALAVIFILANLPGALIEISSGDAFYFVIVFTSIVLPPLGGEILRQAELRGARVPARAAAAAIVLACVIGLVLLGQRQWALIVNAEALVRTGDLQYYAGKSKTRMRATALTAEKRLGLAGIFSTPPATAPAAPVIEALRQFRTSAGNAGSVYVPPSDAAYWGLTEDCDGKSQLAMAAAGIPMLNGYYPDQKACAQDFALLGYHSLPADLGRALDDAGICAHAAAIRSTTVLVLSGPGPRTLSCPGR